MIFDTRKAFTYFSQNFELRASTNNWFSFNCPFCDKARDKQKCAVRFDWQRVKCWECGYSSQIDYFVGEMEDLSPFRAAKMINDLEPTDISLDAPELMQGNNKVKEDITLPAGFTSILHGEGVLANRARAYLTKRGFDLKQLDRLGFGYCNEHSDDVKEDYFGYIIIPFRSKGSLIYYIGRDFLGNQYRYKNPATEKFGVGKADCLYNEDALYMEDIVFITEGWADAQTIGSNAVSTQGWALSTRQTNLLLKSPCRTLVFVPDVGEERGETFYQKALRTAQSFADHKNVFVLDTEKLADQGKDVNEYGKDQLLNLFYQSTPKTYGAITLELLWRK